jgi:3-dehydrosphinganine reductase
MRRRFFGKVETLHDKNAYIFGGSSGIGLETARLLAARGCDVVLFARGKRRLDEAVVGLEELRVSPRQVFGCREVDVADDAAVRRVAADAVSVFGVPDLLVNSAGRARPRVFEEVSPEQFDETMKINLYGAWHTCAAFVPLMRERGGAIVNVASIAGFLGVFGYTDYAASKFGVIGFSEALRSELKPQGLVVSVLCPPDTDTPGFAEENRSKPPETRSLSEGAGVMSAEAVALALVKGVERGDALIIPGAAGRFTYVMKRFTPSLVETFVDQIIRRVQRERP